MATSTDNTPRGTVSLQFDPDLHPHTTLKAFNEFIEQFEFRYEAQFPQPSKTLKEAAIADWKENNDNADPSAAQTRAIIAEVKSRDKVRKLMGFFATVRLQQDWKVAEPDAASRDCLWDAFLTKMRAFYKPTENSILRQYEFSQIAQFDGETFVAFCNRVETEGRTCLFCDCPGTSDCTAEQYAIRHQIVVGTNMEKIREKAFYEKWSLAQLRTEGMKIESALKGRDAVMSNATGVNKVGAYSYKNISQGDNNDKQKKNKFSKKKCYRCGEDFSWEHAKVCKAKNAKCSICHKVGHFNKVCNSKKQVNEVDTEGEADNNNPMKNDDNEEDYEMYRLNIWRIKKSPNHAPKFIHGDGNDTFKRRLVVNNNMVKLLVDTGAKVSVCGMKQAAQWGLLEKMVPSSIKIHPYKSEPIPIRGTATCAVSFKGRTVPVEFHILPGSCEPILSGNKGLQLKIISIEDDDELYNPVFMLGSEAKGEFS